MLEAATATMRLTPRQPVPPLQVPLLGGRRFDLAQQTPERFSLIVFYRGYHCSACRAYLGELDKLRSEFALRGVQVVAISADSLERATHTREEWRLAELPIGYGLPIETGRNWGLYVSSSRRNLGAAMEEPPIFTEPGLYLVEPDGMLYAGSVATMPFARPHFDELLVALDWIERNRYPARGEA
jgi:hypothetical protein